MDMRLVIFIVFGLKIFGVKNAMLPLGQRYSSKFFTLKEFKNSQGHPSILGLRDLQKTTPSSEGNQGNTPFGFPLHKQDDIKKACSIIVGSSGPSSAMQSLLRKYRYDGNGVLIPSSVKYYIKMPQGLGADPILVPLAGISLSSPLGGFVRYYKEVPPIPPSLIPPLK